MQAIRTRVEAQLRRIDRSFEKFSREYRGRAPKQPISARSFFNFFLDDWCPFQETTIGNSVQLQTFTLPSMIVRDFFLSPAACVIFKFKEQGVGDMDLLGLALLASYGNGFDKFYWAGTKVHSDREKGLNQRKSTVEAVIDCLMGAFGSITGTMVGGIRISTSAVKMETYGYKYKGSWKLNVLWDNLVSRLSATMRWISSDDFHPAQMESHVASSLKDLHKGKDYGHFRYMMAVQIAVLSGLHGVGKRGLTDIVYPVKGLGAWEQVKEVPPGERDGILRHLASTFNLEPFGNSCLECILCETSMQREGKIVDPFYKGQHLFLISQEGESLYKKYGEREWLVVADSAPYRSPPFIIN